MKQQKMAPAEKFRLSINRIYRATQRMQKANRWLKTTTAVDRMDTKQAWHYYEARHLLHEAWRCAVLAAREMTELEELTK